MPCVFVTGIGTDVGKTFVTAALIRHLVRAGRVVDGFKPVMSGFDPARPHDSDAGLLLNALRRPITVEELDRISPWRFAAPQSPDLAARAEGRAIDFNALVAFSSRAARSRGMVLIEGVGGVMVPLHSTHTVLDWMSALRVPVLLVAGSYLGAISHTLTALHALAHRNLDIAGVVISESTTPGASLADTAATVARFSSPIEVVGLPRLEAGATPSESDMTTLTRLLQEAG